MTTVVNVNIICIYIKAHFLMQRIRAQKKKSNMFFFCFCKLYKNTIWNTACEKYFTDKHTQKTKKVIFKQSNGQHLPEQHRQHVEGWAMGWGGEEGGGRCKEWWSKHSFTAGWPQGSTFLQDSYAENKRRKPLCYFCWVFFVKTSSNTELHISDKKNKKQRSCSWKL